MQSETKDTLIEIKNNLQGINIRVDEAKNQIREVEYKETENHQSEEQEEKRIQTHEDSVRSLWDNLKHTNIHITGVPEGEEREQEIENPFEKVMTGNSLNLVKKIDIQVREVHRVPNKMNSKRSTPRHTN